MNAGRRGSRRVLRGLRVPAGALWLSLVPFSAMAQEAPPRSAAERKLLEEGAGLSQAGRTREARQALATYLDEHPAAAAVLLALRASLRDDELRTVFLPRAENGAVAAGRRDAVLNRLWIRALLELGLADSARVVAEEWARAVPREPSAHLEVAEVEAASGRLPQAIRALEMGRALAGEEPTFGRRLSAFHLRRGEWESAAEEWARLLAAGEVGVAAVLDVLDDWPGDSEPPLAALWARVADLPAGDPRRGSGVILALRRGAMEAARRVASAPGSGYEVQRRLLLRTYLQEARRHGYWAEAAWAAQRLAGLAEEPARQREWRAVSADMALRDRDTAGARRVFEVLIRDAPPRTEAHRVATRRLFSLRAAERGGTAEAGRIFREYLRLYPEPVADRAEMAIELSRSRVRSGDLSGAGELLEEEADGRLGPVGRARMAGERAVLALYEGRPHAAVELLRTAVEGPSPPAERTRWIRLLAALEPADSVEIAAWGRLALEAARRPEGARADGFLEELSRAPGGGSRPALLIEAARTLAAAGQDAEAARLRRRLVEAYPSSAEAAEALWELGRGSAGTDRAAARAWLERLIVDHPQSAVAPVARRLLAELARDGAAPSR